MVNNVMIKEEDLFDLELDFYGVDNRFFKVGDESGQAVFEVLEDESDGYRSSLEGLRLVTEEEYLKEKPIFFGESLGKVKLIKQEKNDADLYELVDVQDGHVFLEFGTENTDEYYPYFVFRYNPKPRNLASVLSKYRQQ
jgi:hypothetical protein